jgi:hypothetical protein
VKSRMDAQMLGVYLTSLVFSVVPISSLVPSEVLIPSLVSSVVLSLHSFLV